MEIQAVKEIKIVRNVLEKNLIPNLNSSVAS